MCLWGISVLGNVLEYQQSLRICQTAHVKPCLVLILKLHWRLWNTHEFHDSLPEWGHFISCFVQISFQIFHHLKASLKHLSFQQPGGGNLSIFNLHFSFHFFCLPQVLRVVLKEEVTKGLFYGWKWSEERWLAVLSSEVKQAHQKWYFWTV